MLMQIIPSADAIGQTGLDASSAMGARTFETPAGLYPSGDAQPGIRIRIGRLENEARKILREMDDVLA
jgi:hypothetical protein